MKHDGLAHIAIFRSVIPETRELLYIRRVLMGDERHFGLPPQFVVIVGGAGGELHASLGGARTKLNTMENITFRAAP